MLFTKNWRMSPIKLTAFVSAYFAFVLNWAFFRAVFELYQPIGKISDYFIYTVPIVLWALCYGVFLLLSIPYLHKVIIPILLLISAAISYHSVFFNVYFDKDMLDNVLQTTPAESIRMISFSYVAWLLFLGVLPTILYIKVKCTYSIWWQEIIKRIAALMVSLVIIGGTAMIFYQDYASFFRSHLVVKHLILPSNFVAASISKIKKMRAANTPYLAINKDAKLQKTDDKRNVLIFILGETTRAQNWGLNGYKNQTTPKLAQRIKNGEAVINFSDVSSCGIATALSVPCLFSDMGREQYDETRAKSQDNVLDALQYAGVQVQWIENNSDCKGVCTHIPTTNTIHLNLPNYCTNGECLDNIMLPELDKILNTPSNNDLMVVLHTIGSHGPTYFERYTDKERLFTPTCDTQEINRCNDEELRNTYDNSVVYVDQFIDAIITRLQQHQDWKSSVIYASDHGESLGENGIYLHGTPYAIAPKYQTQIPMVLWLSPTWIKAKGINADCLQKHHQKPYSHDNIFHTLIGLSDVNPDTVKNYQANLDIIANCH